jgi:hypothetical protein
LKSSAKKLYGRHHDLHNICEISISQMAVDTFRFTQNFLSSITDKIFMVEIAYHWRHIFTHSPIFGGFCVALQFVLHCFACFVCLLRSPILQFWWSLCYSSFKFVLDLITNVFCGCLVYPGFYVIVLVLYTLYCFIICLYVLSFMMGNPLRFPHKTMLCAFPPCLHDGCCIVLLLYVYACA